MSGVNLPSAANTPLVAWLASHSQHYLTQEVFTAKYGNRHRFCLTTERVIRKINSKWVGKCRLFVKKKENRKIVSKKYKLKLSLKYFKSHISSNYHSIKKSTNFKLTIFKDLKVKTVSFFLFFCWHTSSSAFINSMWNICIFTGK